jgi:hypothetical protein
MDASKLPASRVQPARTPIGAILRALPTAGPRRAGLYNELAELHLDRGDRKAAMSALGDGINAHLDEVQLGQAAALCHKFLRLFPGAVRTHGTLGILLLERGLVADGCDELSRYVYASRITGTEQRAIARLRLAANVLRAETERDVLARHLEALGDAEGAGTLREAPPAGPSPSEYSRPAQLARVLREKVRGSATGVERTAPELVLTHAPPERSTLPPRDQPRRKAAVRPALAAPAAGAPAATRVGALYGPGHRKRGFPDEASTKVWIFHTLIALVGWIVFVERWLEVVDRTSTAFMWVAAVQIVVGAAVILAVTLHWVNHNQKIASKGKRGLSTRWVLPSYTEDALQRAVHLPDRHRVAPVVSLDVGEGSKRYFVGAEA